MKLFPNLCSKNIQRAIPKSLFARYHKDPAEAKQRSEELIKRCNVATRGGMFFGVCFFLRPTSPKKWNCLFYILGRFSVADAPNGALEF